MNSLKTKSRALVAATLVLFLWGALSHMVLIRGVGYSVLREEGVFSRGLEQGGGVEPGLYAFPAPPDWRSAPTTANAQAAWETQFRNGPSGMLIVRPHGEAPFSAGKLVTQLALDVFAVSLGMFVLVCVSATSFWRRAGAVFALGLGGLATVGGVYWNWYAMNNAFMAAQCVDVMGGWLLVACTLAALLPPARGARTHFGTGEQAELSA
jgi:hypothetical protein